MHDVHREYLQLFKPKRHLITFIREAIYINMFAYLFLFLFACVYLKGMGIIHVTCNCKEKKLFKTHMYVFKPQKLKSCIFVVIFPMPED